MPGEIPKHTPKLDDNEDKIDERKPATEIE
jgi:hypothetical protein